MSFSGAPFTHESLGGLLGVTQLRIDSDDSSVCVAWAPGVDRVVSVFPQTHRRSKLYPSELRHATARMVDRKIGAFVSQWSDMSPGVDPGTHSEGTLKYLALDPSDNDQGISRITLVRGVVNTAEHAETAIGLTIERLQRFGGRISVMEVIRGRVSGAAALCEIIGGNNGSQDS